MSKHSLGNLHGIFFIAIPRGRDDGNIPVPTYYRMSAIARSAVGDAEARSPSDEQSPLLRRQLLSKASIIVRCNEIMETVIVCDILAGVTAASRIQIVSTSTQPIKNASEATMALEEILSRGCPRNDGVPGKIEFMWIPIDTGKNHSGLSACHIYDFPFMDFLKANFPKMAKDLDVTKLIRITSNDEPHIIAIYPATEQVVLATDFRFEKL